ncbi:DoxX family membrane protein [Candidatus Woesearchaeota archaeon]|nr:DoxX family membrane protein [Candidatus Woesearchaeota archaeon]
MDLKKLQPYAPLVLRYTIAALFLWFGVNQLLNPGIWVAWLPDWLTTTYFNPLSIIIFNGSFEVLFGALLALGLFTRLSALLLSIHLFGIAFTIGYNDIGIRDTALALAALAVMFYGPGKYALDKVIKKTMWGHTSLAKFLSLYERDL